MLEVTKMKKVMLLILALSLLIVSSGTALADGDDDHMGEDGHMMDWWDGVGSYSWLGIPFMGFMMIGYWLIFIVIALLVYKDAEERKMNGLLWFVLVLLPWIGLLFLVFYIIIRTDNVVVGQTKSPGAILDDRYAKGEISRDEYLRMKKDMSQG
jgi:putative membrane protein